MSSKITVSMKALLRCGEKYLFLKEKLFGEVYPDLPGGTMEYGESPLTTLEREVYEETGLSIISGKLIGLYDFFRADNKGQIVCCVFECCVTTEKRVRELEDGSLELRTDMPDPRCEVEDCDSIKLDFSKNPANEEFVDYEWLTAEEAVEKLGSQLPIGLRELLAKRSV